MGRILQLSRAVGQELLELLSERERRKAGRSFHAMFPDEDTIWDGPKTKIFDRGETIYARRRYAKAMSVFWATGQYREVNVMAANRVGKTVMGAYAVTCFATGLYPPWWDGRRYPGPIDIWVAGQTNETTRDIIQAKLFGDVALIDGRKGLLGNGMMPSEMIVNPPTWKAGVTELVDTVQVRHTSGGYSRIGVKSYQQGRLSFEGTEKFFVWTDEEPPRDIYNECLIRTMTVEGGLVLSTFTPLMGLSDTSKLFIRDEMA